MDQAVTIQEISHLPLDSKKIMVKVRLLLHSTHKILVVIPLEARRRTNKIELNKLAKAVSEDKMV
jgi:nucleoside-triphosphatase THEP1